MRHLPSNVTNLSHLPVPDERAANVPLLYATLARVAMNPATWDQKTYVNECGTAFCFAGHALLEAGWTWHQDGQFWLSPDRKVYSDVTGNAASHVLGLTVDEQCDLYAAGNTLAQLHTRVRVVAENQAARAMERAQVHSQATAAHWATIVKEQDALMAQRKAKTEAVALIESTNLSLADAEEKIRRHKERISAARTELKMLGEQVPSIYDLTDSRAIRERSNLLAGDTRTETLTDQLLST